MSISLYVLAGYLRPDSLVHTLPEFCGEPVDNALFLVSIPLLRVAGANTPRVTGFLLAAIRVGAILLSFTRVSGIIGVGIGVIGGVIGGTTLGSSTTTIGSSITSSVVMVDGTKTGL